MARFLATVISHADGSEPVPPPVERHGESLLDGVLGNAQVTRQPGNDRNDPAPFPPEHGLNLGACRGPRHHQRAHRDRAVPDRRDRRRPAQPSTTLRGEPLVTEDQPRSIRAMGSPGERHLLRSILAPSSRGESHPPALTERSVNLSVHSALLIWSFSVSVSIPNG